MNFITLLDYVGTFAFAISGIRLASAKHFDWFGAYVVGFVTAVGGGTLRDLLLGLPPFWMQNVSYLVVSGFAFLFVVGLRKYVIRLNNTFFIFDAVGLGLFAGFGHGTDDDLRAPARLSSELRPGTWTRLMVAVMRLPVGPDPGILPGSGP